MSVRPDPLLDLLARMIRTAQAAERQPRRVTLVAMDGGRTPGR